MYNNIEVAQKCGKNNDDLFQCFQTSCSCYTINFHLCHKTRSNIKSILSKFIGTNQSNIQNYEDF